MKKVFVVLVLCILCVVFCACGGGAETTDSSDSGNNEIATENSESDSDWIRQVHVPIIDDDYLLMKVRNFHTSEKQVYNNNDEDDFYYKEDEVTLKTEMFVWFDVTNHLNRIIEVGLYNGYVFLGDDPVRLVYHEGNGKIYPGGETRILCSVEREDEEPIKSLDELYGLNGKIEVKVYSKDEETLEDDKTREYTFDLR